MVYGCVYDTWGGLVRLLFSCPGLIIVYIFQARLEESVSKQLEQQSLLETGNW